MTPAPSPAARRLLDRIDALAGTRVAIWGDLVLDEFLLGEVGRISREAPVLILQYLRSEFVPGGAANTAANVASIGAIALPVGLVGDDESGKRLLDALRARGVDISGVRVVPGLATPTKTRVSGAALHTTQQQIVRIDRGGSLTPAPALARSLAASAAERGLAADALVIADYGYGTVDPVAARRIARRLRRRGRTVTVDSRWRLLEFRGATAVTPNEPEVESALGIPLRDATPRDLARAGRALGRRLSAETVVITRGRRGMAVCRRGRGPADLVPVYGTDEVADVTGAGDTVTAVFAAALASGADSLQAARLANYAGGLVVMKQGTATVTADELRRAVRLDHAPLPERAAASRREGASPRRPR
jgi:D-glycero-beta-D-manno-heptose-7-phosphate kinase